MNVRWPLMVVLFAADLTFARFAEANEPPRHPNVVVILADDLGYGDLSCYGAKLTQTPNCDRLAREGRRFSDAHSPSSVCSPTRYGLLSGRYCWRTALQRQVLGVTAPLHIEPDRPTLASVLKKHGYATAAVGKWHLGYGSPPRTDYNKPLTPGPKEVGFDYHFGVPSNHGDLTRCFVENDQVVGRKPGEPFELPLKGGMPKGLAQRRVDDRVDQVLTEKALAWLERNKDRPFFLYFTPVAVHNPVTPNKQFRGQSKCGIYGDYVRELDWCVGQLLDFLDRHKLADNTLVIFSSDNGGVVTADRDSAEFPLTLEDDEGGAVSKHYRAAQRDAYAAGHRACGELRGRKHSIYEGGNRVPFLARWPGKVPAGTTCDEVVCLTDLLATAAALVGERLPRNAGEDSHDIGPALRGEKLGRPVREATVLHNAEGVFALRQGPWKLIAAGAADGAPKASPWVQEGANQLYHLGDDPTETTNVWDKHPGVVERLTKLLKQYRDQGVSRPVP
jgi:arylsulfatase A-like enzyme